MPHKHPNDTSARRGSTAGYATWAVVPVKPFACAKRRLASVLRPEERSQLARLMLEDVLDALSATRELSGIIVVTQDPEAAAIARHTGCIALADPADAGINPAIEIATRFLADQADAGMIVVPSDIPHLSPGVVADVIARVSRSPSVVAVPAKDGGTNMLACRPVQIIQSGFGPDSFQHHRRLAQDAGVVFDAVPHHETAHDIDRPEDLATFLSFASATRTHAFLDTLNIDAPNIATRLHSALESVAPV